MTDNEKATIRALRYEGLGYCRIAKKMGLNLETVKSFCRRQGLREKDKMTEKNIDDNYNYAPCKNCGNLIMQLPKRKKKIFCSDKCRNSWWNDHLHLVNRKAYYEFKCMNCGKECRIYGDHRRKYCSHECYFAARFG